MSPVRPWSAAFAVLAAALALAAPLTAAAESSGAPAAEPAAAPLRVADLAWLAGAWRGTMGAAPIEEHWTAPDDGVMLGMFRWGKERELYEILLLEDGPEGAVLRLRHFDPGLAAWESEADGPTVFRSVAHGDGWAAFVTDQGSRLELRRRDDGGLTVRLIRTTDDGTESALDFDYRPLGR